MPRATKNVVSENGQVIHEGDTVRTAFRGGKREGKVIHVVTDEDAAAKEHVNNPPKVIFNDQHGHRVAHNPSTLEVVVNKDEEHTPPEPLDEYDPEGYGAEEYNPDE